MLLMFAISSVYSMRVLVHLLRRRPQVLSRLREQPARHLRRQVRANLPFEQFLLLPTNVDDMPVVRLNLLQLFWHRTVLLPRMLRQYTGPARRMGFAANCSSSSTVLPGLGVCLSELVSVPQHAGTGTAPPLPTITGLDTPTVVTNSGVVANPPHGLGLHVHLACDRGARGRRAKRTAAFAFAHGTPPPSGTSYRTGQETDTEGPLRLLTIEPHVIIKAKAIADAITTGMEYVDGQLVAVRDGMQEAK
ncbi:hypothetical protein PTI98_007094 [Pleurotus ostreatus]|nr:hypothetical protein PTI98_007094 [Pleurotus ostreatus]